MILWILQCVRPKMWPSSCTTTDRASLSLSLVFLFISSYSSYRLKLATPTFAEGRANPYTKQKPSAFKSRIVMPSMAYVSRYAFFIFISCNMAFTISTFSASKLPCCSTILRIHATGKPNHAATKACRLCISEFNRLVQCYQQDFLL